MRKIILAAGSALALASNKSTRPQPTASVDPMKIWWQAQAVASAPRSQEPIFDPDKAAAAVIQAYGDARADAARREGEQAGLEKAEKAANEYNNHLTIGAAVSRSADLRDGLKNGAEVARMIATAIRSLKENPNAG